MKVAVNAEGRQSVGPGAVVRELFRRGEFTRLARMQRRVQQHGELASEPIHGRPWLDSERAMRCAEADCPAIYEADGPPACPRCGSHQAVPVARALNETIGWKKPEPEAS